MLQTCTAMGAHDNQVCLCGFCFVDDFLPGDALDEEAFPCKSGMLDALETLLHGLLRACLHILHIGGIGGKVSPPDGGDVNDVEQRQACLELPGQLHGILQRLVGGFAEVEGYKNMLRNHRGILFILSGALRL
jgi:hypothetical protein